ncbi:hypothetical protein [Novosphingobium gossypii]|uniref:hypothetical protein n=1 Tax=Novosphingobium gossypii TaxID=1604774 RepID=UPI003D1A91C4
MRMPSKRYLVGAAVLTLLGAGAAQAAGTQLHTMQVDAPDGSVVHVQYTGDVAPRIQFVPADAMAPAAAVPIIADPFAHMAQISAMMDAQMDAMMQHAALMQQQAAQLQQHAVATGAGGAAPNYTVAGNLPQGVQVSYYSSSTDANGCTRSTSYNSNGSGAQPKVTEVASDGCDAAKAPVQAIPAKAQAPVEQAPPPGHKV